ncbi:MAG TPA: metallophosphoesterase [Gemmatimonadaceae bacterium]|nr:metallophosphoesterase [Gemmatimonadaceae bacterium]
MIIPIPPMLSLRANPVPSSVLLIVAVGFAAACASGGAPARPAPSSLETPFRVAVLGDMPYHAPSAPDRDSIMAAYRAVLDTIAAERVAFVVHVGDITGATCSDSLYAQRLSEFSSLPHPVIYTFGDNEWTDCARDGHDPLERLTKLRQVFTAGSTSLGGRPLPLERQSDDPRFSAYRENVRWTHGSMLFLTIHVVGSNNNRGRDSTPPNEFLQRTAANIAWLRESFSLATRERRQGIAIFMQANPTVTPAAPAGQPRPPSGFTETMQALQELVLSFDGHVALLHGDTHTFRVDQPLRDAQGRIRTTFTRAETYGNPSFHALIMSVHPGTPVIFRFEPLVIPRNASPAIIRP